MSISEACSCGASFTAERKDELRLLKDWRANHRCERKEDPLVIMDNSSITVAHDYTTIPELHIGFRPNEGDDDDD